MLEMIKDLQGMLEEKKSLLQSNIVLPQGCPDVLITISNTILLLSELVKFYDDEKAKYFPHAISNTITQIVLDIGQLLKLMTDSSNTSAESMLTA
jgi:hypothetical protein